MNDNLISVLMPVYNVGQYIEQAISSVLEQRNVQVELIVVDDCSTDDTYEIARRCARSDARIRLFRNSENLKICKTLNIALNLSKGEYIARLDGDDYSDLDKLSKQLDYLDKNDLDIVGCQLLSVNEQGVLLSKSAMPVGEKAIEACIKYGSPISHIWLAKRCVYDVLGGYRNIPYAEDFDFILRAIDFGFKCDNHPDYLTYVRLRNGNTASTASLKQRLTHNFVLNMHNYRKVAGDDFFSDEKLIAATKYSSFLSYFHSRSTICLNLACKTRSRFLKSCFYLMAGIMSVYNMQYLYDRFMFKFMIKRYSK